MHILRRSHYLAGSRVSQFRDPKHVIASNQLYRRRGLDNNDQINPVSYLFDIDSSFIARTMHAFEQDGFQIIGDATLPANSSPQAVESQTERFDNNKSLLVSFLLPLQ
jgi:hypothetical protein